MTLVLLHNLLTHCKNEITDICLKFSEILLSILVRPMKTMTICLDIVLQTLHKVEAKFIFRQILNNVLVGLMNRAGNLIFYTKHETCLK